MLHNHCESRAPSCDVSGYDVSGYDVSGYALFEYGILPPWLEGRLPSPTAPLKSPEIVSPWNLQFLVPVSRLFALCVLCFLKGFKIYFYFTCMRPACMWMHHACAGPTETRKGCRILWNWSFDDCKLLRMGSGFSPRASALNG